MAQKKRSLMFRLMTSVNIAALVVLIAMTSFILNKTSVISEKQIDDEVEALMGSLQHTLADYLITADIKSIQQMSDDIVDDNTINEVYIFDKDKKLIASAKNKNAKVIEETTKLYESKKDITKLGDASKAAIGSVFVKYNHNEIVEIKKEFILFGAISIVISQLLLAFVMWFSLSRSVKTINTTTDKLRGLADSTSKSSKEVEDISKEVSSSANEQAASIQETVATLDEITSQVTATVESVVNSTKKSEESLHIATEGKTVVTEMIHSMESIGSSNKEIMEEIARGNERIGGIVKIINEISEKTAVINDIVFQTKLLSFNASVEAARAGEHGKGFAVVAEEVGNLAQMSGKASTEISAILSDSIVKVNSVILETNRNVEALTKVGTEKVSDGMKIAERCGTVLEDIVTNATIVKNMMNEISVASKEQAEGVRNITAAMNQLDQATLSNNKSAATSSQSAKELSEHSIDLKEAVVELEKEIFGGEQTGVVTPVKKPVIVSEVKKSVETPAPKKSNVLPMPAKKPTLVQAPRPQPQARPETKADVTPIKSKPGLSTPGYDDPRFEDV
jgi:methyl-accepting chemotaxis protein